MTVLVLDAAAVSAIAGRRDERFGSVRSALEAARRLGRDVVVPAVVLAELYRGQGHDQTVDAYLSRDAEVLVQDTDRSFARLVGSLLTAARTGSKDIVDAHVVASAVKAGGGVVLTGDRKDLERLAVPYPHVHISAI